VLWRFSRPHTIVGTTLSVLALYAIAVTDLAGGDLGAGLFDLWWTLVAAWCVNVFIVGINQLEDIEIDRINKPHLPIAAGDLSPATGRRIVAVAAAVPLLLAATQGAAELVAVALGLAVGTAYSVPPLRLKRFPALASLSITFVRSLVVNLGVWLHFSHALGGGSEIHPAVWALIAVTIPFSFAIAILKDVPDIEGDRRYAIATFSVRLGARPVFALGVAVLTLGELGMATIGAALLDGASTAVLVAGHLSALALLWLWAARVDLADRASIVRFYMRVWVLFFCEYAIVAGAYLLG
jgi:homogentisate phytyltransferase/homogentisate geranylgeranyltransferase